MVNNWNIELLTNNYTMGLYISILSTISLIDHNIPMAFWIFTHLGGWEPPTAPWSPNAGGPSWRPGKTTMELFFMWFKQRKHMKKTSFRKMGGMNHPKFGLKLHCFNFQPHYMSICINVVCISIPILYIIYKHIMYLVLDMCVLTSTKPTTSMHMYVLWTEHIRFINV